MINTFTWYDLETSGTNPDLDQIYQFASVKTDASLNVIDHTERNILCRPRIDVVPHPMAFLTHMIDINDTINKGVSEFELSKIISREFLSSHGNFISGYNTNSFDDQFIRRLMFRNLQDPYAHEWRDNNGRFDLYKYVQMVYAFRPGMLSWRKNDSGNDSLKLEHLVQDNNLGEHKAHDALSDVKGTISVAKHLREQNQKLFDYMVRLTDKNNVSKILFNDPKIENRTPVIHVDSIYGKARRGVSILLPISIDSTNKNKALCIDLTGNVQEMLSMSSDDIKKYLFTKREELEADAPRVPANGISINNMPVVMEYSEAMMPSSVADSMDIDLDLVEKNRMLVINELSKNTAFAQRIQKAFVNDMPPPKDSFSTLYSGGFFTDKDKNIRARMHNKVTEGSDAYLLQTESVYENAMKTSDKERQFDLMLRAKWTNFGKAIISSREFSGIEFKTWMKHVTESLFSGEKGLTIEQFEKEVEKVKIERVLTEDESYVLTQVEKYIANTKIAYSKLMDIDEKVSDFAEYEKSNDPNVSRFLKLSKSLNDDNGFNY